RCSRRLQTLRLDHRPASEQSPLSTSKGSPRGANALTVISGWWTRTTTRQGDMAMAHGRRGPWDHRGDVSALAGHRRAAAGDNSVVGLAQTQAPPSGDGRRVRYADGARTRRAADCR